MTISFSDRVENTVGKEENVFSQKKTLHETKYTDI